MKEESFLYYTEQGKWVENTHPKIKTIQLGNIMTKKVVRTFNDMALFYANIIDYIRIVLVLIALILIIINESSDIPSHVLDFLNASLILSSTLLDWVDGPVARYFNQSTVMGCGWDWLADIITQYSLAIWIVYRSNSVYYKIFSVLFATVEISTGLFDFAITATSIYPNLNPKLLPWYFIVEDWVVPDNTYLTLGIICWLANTLYPLGVCLKIQFKFLFPLIPFVLLYSWHEVCQLIFMVKSFKDYACMPHQQGIEYLRDCSEQEKILVKEAYDISEEIKSLELSKILKDGKQLPPEICKNIQWINLFINGQYSDYYAAQAVFKEKFAKFIQELIKEAYPNESNRNILSYGFITSPKHGTLDQSWHIDYDDEVSNLFIPLHELTLKNATHFIRGPIKSPMPESNYFPNPSALLDFEETKTLQICQVISKPFTILKLFPGVCHRGIANGEAYDRVLFCISTSPKYIQIENYENTAFNFSENNDQEVLIEDLKKLTIKKE